MIRDGSDWMTCYFETCSRDVTPAPVGHAAHVLFAPASHDPEVTRHCASVLSETERRRANRLASAGDRARFEQRRAFRRFCGTTVFESSRPLSEIRFEETETGRPYLPDAPDLWFSFSSCRIGMLGAWSSTHGIGVDLEDHTGELEAVDLARRFFSGAEAKVVEGVQGQERLRTFFQLWSLKEAALKSIGEGLPFGLDAFQFELDPNPRIVHAPPDHGGPEKFEAHLIEGTDSSAALVTRTLLRRRG
jgi:phosphopantetheinyl transferase